MNAEDPRNWQKVDHQVGKTEDYVVTVTRTYRVDSCDSAEEAIGLAVNGEAILLATDVQAEIEPLPDEDEE